MTRTNRFTTGKRTSGAITSMGETSRKVAAASGLGSETRARCMAWGDFLARACLSSEGKEEFNHTHSKIPFGDEYWARQPQGLRTAPEDRI